MSSGALRKGGKEGEGGRGECMLVREGGREGGREDVPVPPGDDVLGELSRQTRRGA
jgi:hypothetical protein